MPQHISCLDIPLKYLNGCNVCRNKMFPTKILDMLLVFFTNLLPTDLMEGKNAHNTRFVFHIHFRKNLEAADTHV